MLSLSVPFDFHLFQVTSSAKAVIFDPRRGYVAPSLTHCDLSVSRQPGAIYVLYDPSRVCMTPGLTCALSVRPHSQVTESGLPATSRPQLVRSRTLPAIVVPGVGSPADDTAGDDTEKKGQHDESVLIGVLSTCRQLCVVDTTKST